jgi:hypothetical protein
MAARTNVRGVARILQNLFSVVLKAQQRSGSRASEVL